MSNVYTSNIKLRYGDAEFIFLKQEKKETEHTQAMILHSHFFYEVHFNTEKLRKIELLTKEVLINTGEILVINPKTVHYSQLYKNSRSALQVMLNKVEDGSGFYEYFKTALESIAQTPFKVSGELIDTIRSFLADDVEDSVKGYCRAKSDASRLIQLLFENINGFMQDKMPATYKRVDSIFELEFDEMVTNTNLTVKEIAETLGYSVRHTSRKIVETYGKTLSQIRKQKALSAAKKLIEIRRMPLEEVAYISGFKSSKALREAFKLQENTTPTKYRKSMVDKSK